jgi:hypothetical protein
MIPDVGSCVKLGFVPVNNNVDIWEH